MCGGTCLLIYLTSIYSNQYQISMIWWHIWFLCLVHGSQFSFLQITLRVTGLFKPSRNSSDSWHPLTRKTQSDPVGSEPCSHPTLSSTSFKVEIRGCESYLSSLFHARPSARASLHPPWYSWVAGDLAVTVWWAMREQYSSISSQGGHVKRGPSNPEPGNFRTGKFVLQGHSDLAGHGCTLCSFK